MSGVEEAEAARVWSMVHWGHVNERAFITIRVVMDTGPTVLPCGRKSRPSAIKGEETNE